MSTFAHILLGDNAFLSHYRLTSSVPEMLRIMIQENATQRGHNAASTLDSVAAAMGQLVYLILSGGFCGNPQKPLQLEKLRGHIEAGSGVGREIIFDYLPPNSLTMSEVAEAVAIIKASDKHLDIINRVKARIAAEAKDNAKLKPEVVAAAERAVEATQKKQEAKPVLFDATCNRLRPCAEDESCLA